MGYTVATIRQNTATAPRWCSSPGKRRFDLICGTALLIASLPLLLVVASLVKLTSQGPILFRQRRVGRAWEEITVLKFRTMQHSLQPAGPGLTQKGDLRVTRIGSLLRRWKLDELPQLINVARGDMSLVGPRPDLREYLVELPPRLRHVTALRPGLTGWATLRYRNEEQLLAAIPADELKDAYIRVLLPRKARLDLVYGKRSTLWSDVALLLRTGMAIFR